MKNIPTFLSIILLINLLGACDHQRQVSLKTKTYTMKEEPLSKILYFSGVIQPIQQSTVISHVDAVVETVHYHYGQWVKRGDVIVTLNSSELQKQYNDSLTEYLKAKDNYTVAKAKFVGTSELWEAGLLSKNNFLSEKSGLSIARVSLMQARQKLSQILEKMDSNQDYSQKLTHLTIAEFDKVQQALTSKHHLIHLKAPRDGVLLYPPKTGEEKTPLLTVGTAIKSGQVLALVGDLTGVSIEIDVPEIDIDKIHTGMQAKITGIALGKQVLQGKLTIVNAQASSSGNSGLPSFNALVEVQHLQAEQSRLIKVGMSASVALAISDKKQLVVPIQAIKQEKGRSIVHVRAPDGSISRHVISTGSAQADKVVVTSGLKAGEMLIYE